MRSDCQLRTFNVEVTASSIIAPPPCPYSCPPVLVPSFGTTGRVALDGVLLFLSMTSIRRGHDGPRRYLPATLGLPYSSSDVFPSSAWALRPDINMGRGPQILWPHNSPSKSCYPAPQTERRVLMSSECLTGLSSLVICWH